MGERPKRPLSAYMIWLNENREAIKKEHPGIKVTEIAKRGGELWRGLRDKTEWENKAAKIKEDYTKLIKEFEANGGSTEKVSKKRGKTSKKTAKKSKKKESEEEDESGEEESD
jgi:hypothetical protein